MKTALNPLFSQRSVGGEAVLSASWREGKLSQDSHVLFMSLPLIFVTVNELLVR